MINQMIVSILVDRIINSGINPVTNTIMVLDDIKSVEYRLAVENKILLLSQED